MAASWSPEKRSICVKNSKRKICDQDPRDGISGRRSLPVNRRHSLFYYSIEIVSLALQWGKTT
jgi:hypothetical protein